MSTFRTSLPGVAQFDTNGGLTPELAARIEEILAKFRPTLNFDGGDVKLSGFQDGVAEVTMLGACIDCPVSVLTMTIGVKRILLKEVPEIKEVRAVFANGALVPGLKDFSRTSS